MKRISATALIAALATAGLATTAAANLSFEVERIAPQADLETATAAERAQIASIVHADGSDNSKRAQIRAILD